MSDNNFAAYLPHINVEEGMGRVLKNKKLYARLLKSYLATTNTSAIEAAVAEGNISAAREAAHSIKGVSANLSIIKTFEISKDLEANFKTGEPYNDNLKLLKACIDEAVPILQKLIAELETV